MTLAMDLTKKIPTKIKRKPWKLIPKRNQRKMLKKQKRKMMTLEVSMEMEG